MPQLRPRLPVIALLLGLSVPAAAQTYPDRAVKIIVPSPPAGGYDVFGRLIADALSRRLGQSFVVENRTGAGTLVGTEQAAEAPPDGYTLLVGGLSNIIFNVGLYKNLRHNPIKEFVPVSLPFNISYSLVASKSSGLATPQQVVAAAKANPGKLTLANAGRGTGQHILGAAFMGLTGTRMLEVPYRGSAAVYPDLLSGRVDLFVDSTPAALPYITSGQVNGIGILAAKRSTRAPDFPTMTEGQVPGLEIDGWIGLFAPTKTPPEVIARLQREIAALMPELTPRFLAAGADPMMVEPDKLRGYVQADYDKWIPVIKDAGISLD